MPAMMMYGNMKINSANKRRMMIKNTTTIVSPPKILKVKSSA